MSRNWISSATPVPDADVQWEVGSSVRIGIHRAKGGARPCGVEDA